MQFQKISTGLFPGYVQVYVYVYINNLFLPFYWTFNYLCWLICSLFTSWKKKSLKNKTSLIHVADICSATYPSVTWWCSTGVQCAGLWDLLCTRKPDSRELWPGQHSNWPAPVRLSSRTAQRSTQSPTWSSWWARERSDLFMLLIVTLHNDFCSGKSLTARSYEPCTLL